MKHTETHQSTRKMSVVSFPDSEDGLKPPFMGKNFSLKVMLITFFKKCQWKEMGIQYTPLKVNSEFSLKNEWLEDDPFFLGDLSVAFTVKLRWDFLGEPAQKKTCYDGVSVRNQVYLIYMSFILV